MLEFIEEYVDRHNDFPSYIDIQEGLGFASPNSVTTKLKALVRKGYLTKIDPQTYDFPKDLYFLTQSKREELREFMIGVLDLWERGATLTPPLRQQYIETIDELLS